MRAVHHAAHGGADVLEIVELADPVPGPGEVVVAVRAAALNRLDVLQRTGPPLLPGFRLPHVAGMDLAGDVVALGPDLDGPRPGTPVLVKPGVHCGACAFCRRGEDRLCAAPSVIGGTRPGGYAELCLVPGSNVFPIPAGIAYEQAAVVPTAFSTAWRAVVRTGEVAPGEVVVVHGPGSGVTHAVVQIAKRAGARVVVTGRRRDKLDRLGELGVDLAVEDGDPERVVEAVRNFSGSDGADLVVDHTGTGRFSLSLRLLAQGGRLVTCGTTTGSTVTFELPALYHRGLRILGVGSQSYAEFVTMLEHYWRGGYQAPIDSRFPLERVADAQARLESGDAFGKVLVTP